MQGKKKNNKQPCNIRFRTIYKPKTQLQRKKRKEKERNKKLKEKEKKRKEKKKKKEKGVSQERAEVGWTFGSAGCSLLMPTAAITGVLCSGASGKLRSWGAGIKSMFAEPAITEPAVTCSAR